MKFLLQIGMFLKLAVIFFLKCLCILKKKYLLKIKKLLFNQECSLRPLILKIPKDKEQSMRKYE